MDGFESSRRTLRTATLARGDAMEAGLEWATMLFQTQARMISPGALCTLDGELAIMTIIDSLRELPLASDLPSEEEEHWELRVQMYARLTNMTQEDADTQLRATFRQYMELLLAAVNHSLPGEASGSSILVAFGNFWSGQCGRPEIAIRPHIDRIRRLYYGK